MFQRVLATRAQWGSVLLLATVTLTSCLISIPTVAIADEIPSVVATVQGQSISAEELTSALHGELMRLEIQRYQVLKEKLDELIADKIFSLEAAQRGVPVQQFVQDEIVAKIPAVTPEQVQAFYEANKSRIKQPLEKISEQINRYTYDILSYLEPLSLPMEPQHPFNQVLLSYVPKTLKAKYADRIFSRIPDIHKKAIISCHIASQLVYIKGLSWTPKITDILPILCQDPELVN